jgi:NTE family protein
MRIRNSLLCLICTLFLSAALFPQSPEPSANSTTDRKRIGLALSGGGALGLAHIGVLMYFEQHRIPVDLIAGTSMGGLVGGLYSTGLDASELNRIALSSDWNDLLRAAPKFEDRPVAEKQEWNRATSGLTLHLGRRLSLPPGLNPGQALALLLSRYTAPYSHVQSFDQLPVPFRSVATDLVSGDAFVLQRGSLSLAMRATMALPGVFTPVKWDNAVLVDGGIVDNIPTDVVKDMGADVVIAVSLETPGVKAEDLNNLGAILRQAVTVSVLQNERRSLKLADVIIPVKFGNLTSGDYEQAYQIISLGYKTAESNAAALHQYQLSQEAWDAYVHERESRVKRTPISGEVVAVESPQKSILTDARDEVSRKLSGDVTVEKLEDTLTGMTAATGLPAAFYGVAANRKAFEIQLEERPSRTVLLRPTLFTQISSGEPSRTRLRIDWTTIWKNSYKSRLLGDITIGYDPALRAEYYKPIGGSAYFVAPGFVLQREHVQSYVGTKDLDKVRDRFAGTFYAGLGTWRFVQLRFGAIGGYDRYESRVDLDGVVARSSPFVNPEVVGVFNNQDSGSLPSRGLRINASAGYSFRDSPYPYLRWDFSRFYRLPKSFSAFVLGQGGTSFGTKLSYYDQFTAGGFGQLGAYRYQEFHANTLVLGGGGALYRIPRFERTQWRPAIAAWYEAGRFDEGSLGWSTHQSTSIGTFVSTPLGVTGLTVSLDEDGRARLRFSVGVF